MNNLASTVTSHITVRDRQVRYRVDGAGLPVILLHGIGRSLEDWTEQHELLRARYRVYSMDLAGSGWSEPLNEPYTLPALARFVAEFLDAMEIAEPAHVVGNSLGGAIAMQLAVDDPARVASLVLVNSAGFGRQVSISLRLLAIRPLGRVLLRPSRYSARRIERSLFHDPTLVTPARVEHTFALAQRPHAARVLLETARTLGTIRGVRPQWRQTLLLSLAELDIPTLIVWGDRDLILPAAHLNAARTHLPHAQTHLFPDTGHMPQIEHAEAFSEHVESFWDTGRGRPKHRLRQPGEQLTRPDQLHPRHGPGLQVPDQAAVDQSEPSWARSSQSQPVLPAKHARRVGPVTPFFRGLRFDQHEISRPVIDNPGTK